jgi:endonuclease/exonuclease/phosphatase family metal-dependent hydrolase
MDAPADWPAHQGSPRGQQSGRRQARPPAHCPAGSRFGGFSDAVLEREAVVIGMLARGLHFAAFDPGPRPGTFQSCSTTNRLDYIFVTTDLAPHVVGGGIERHGLWGDPDNKKPPKGWGIYPGIENPGDAASDHAAVFVDIDI